MPASIQGETFVARTAIVFIAGIPIGFNLNCGVILAYSQKFCGGASRQFTNVDEQNNCEYLLAV
jgi:hypothetical protein